MVLFFEGRCWRNLGEMRESLPNSEWQLMLGFLKKRQRLQEKEAKRVQAQARRRR